MIIEIDEDTIIRSFREFILKSSFSLKKINSGLPDYAALNNYALLPNQAIYVFDFKNLTVAYQRNIQSILGYSEKEFTYDLLTSYFHPDEIRQYLMITKFFIQFVHSYKPDPNQVLFSLSYRIRKKDNSFIKVLRHTVVYSNDEDRNMVSNLSILTDVTDIMKDNFITYSVKGEGREVELAKMHFINFYQNDFFSKREKQLLIQLSLGRNSSEISKDFNVSKNTIDTHRRNMLHKAGCKNTMELIDFSRRNGIL
jgi:DNA-binding CsgD family transcriptional regulator